MRIRLLGHQVAVSMVALAALEIAIFYTVLVLTAFEQHEGQLWLQALVFSTTMAISLLAVGLYSARQRVRRTGVLVRVIVAVIAGIILTVPCFYIVPSLWINTRELVLASVSAAVLVLLIRLGFSRFMDETPFRRRVIVYGTGQRASVVSQLRRRADQRGFILSGFVRPEGEGLNVPEARVVKPQGALLDFCRTAGIDEIVVAMDDRRRAFPVRELLECRLAGIDVIDLLTFLERETGRVRIDVLNPSWLIFGKGFRRGSLRRFTSSLLDVLASIILLVVSLPLMLATMIAIKLEEGWRAPVFYRQERVGFGGRTFRLLKFRSMRRDAEANGQAIWAQKHDPRITRVGAVIRKLRIDELPQILNVLRGDMCFVGPRPERPQFVAELAEAIPFYMQRHCVKPGITGWAQLCYSYGASQQDAVEKLQYDLYYIKNSGFLLDLSILVQTAEVVLFGKGAR